jgi:hypothetical protein
LKEIKITELDVCKTQVVPSPICRYDFANTVELYSTFIKKIKEDNPQLKIEKLVFLMGTSKGARTRMESEVLPESQMSPTLLPCGSSG